MNFKYIVLFGMFFFLFSCKKENPTIDTSSHLKKGWLVLNEGLYQLNNASMSWIDLASSEVNNQIFEERTGRLLGDTGNDMIRYGDKLYILTSVSSTVEILDGKTLKPIKQLSITEDGVAQQPQNFIAFNGSVYFSTFGGKVWCLDTTNLGIKTKISVGLNPDRMATDGTYLYVSNSGGLNPEVFDSTVSVIRLLNNQEIKKIVVGKNPGEIMVGPNQQVYVITRGDYGAVPNRLHRINTNSLSVDTTFSIKATHLCEFNSQEIIVGYYNAVNKIELTKFNVNTNELVEPRFIDLTGFQTFYGISYLAQLNKFILKDAMSHTTSGKVLIYKSNGILERQFQVGLNPNQVIYYE